MKTPTNNFDHSMLNAITTHELGEMDNIDSLQQTSQINENQILNSLPRVDNTSTFSEEEDEMQERIEVE